jgi:hypothetical protein
MIIAFENEKKIPLQFGGDPLHDPFSRHIRRSNPSSL